MKYCYHCGRTTGGEPLFCGSCGRSYNVKLCPRLHVSPRYATCCSQCGSRELSTPQPKVPFLWRIAAFLLRIVAGVLLVYLSLTVLVAVLKNPAVQNGIVILGLLLMVLWALWAMLPEWFRSLIHRLLKRKERRHGR